jgi:hypothetical protein
VTSWLSVKVEMITGARTFQIGLPRRTTSYWSMSGSGLAIAGRVVVLLADVPGDGGVVVVG